ncbi:Histone H1 like protein [Argiope bruennichi]|uniref:Histone H1 like protein n=1 Tax=Argiope bruennichi TaxID=94029 RepID=A0A8T0FN38_ARGBR|nr:Histone H1 like protein [Argiope bruennichi]
MESPAKKVAVHPKVSVMVDEAIKTLAEPKGSSMRAINKYISATYDVDTKKLSVYIKKYLKAAVERGDMVQPTGKGANGSFKFKKTKAETKPKVDKVKPAKPLKLLTSTPNKTSKPKKVTMKPPNNSPVKKMKLTDDEEAPGLLTEKVKKPKKLVAKKDKSKIPGSPKEESKKAATSPKIVKAKGAAKSTKAKKSPKPKKIAASKKAAAKGTPPKVEQK